MIEGDDEGGLRPTGLPPTDPPDVDVLREPPLPGLLP